MVGIDQDDPEALRAVIAAQEREITRLKAIIHQKGVYDDPPDEPQPSHLQQVVVDSLDDLSSGGFAQQLLNVAPIQIYAKDARERRYVYLNAKARKLLNYPNVNPLGMKDIELVQVRSEWQRYYDLDSQVMQDKRPHTVVEPWTALQADENGIYREIRTTRYPIVAAAEPEGPSIGVISVSEDVSFFTKQRSIAEVVKLISHDWAADTLLALRKQLEETLTLVANGQHPDYLTERQRAQRLLKLGQDTRLYTPASDEDVPLAPTAETFAGTLLTFALNQYIPICFMSAYLMHLSWYYATDLGKSGSLKSRTYDTFFVSTALFDYMGEFFSTCITRKADSGQSIVAKCDQELTMAANLDQLRILVYQQLRNHSSHGDSNVPLVVDVRSEDMSIYLTFRSLARGGKCIASEFRERIGRTPGLKAPLIDLFGNQVKTSGMGYGLYFCHRITTDHGGDWRVYDDGKCNCFEYRFPQV